MNVPGRDGREIQCTSSTRRMYLSCDRPVSNTELWDIEGLSDDMIKRLVFKP